MPRYKVLVLVAAIAMIYVGMALTPPTTATDKILAEEASSYRFYGGGFEQGGANYDVNIEVEKDPNPEQRNRRLRVYTKNRDVPFSSIDASDSNDDCKWENLHVAWRTRKQRVADRSLAAEILARAEGYGKLAGVMCNN